MVRQVNILNPIAWNNDNYIAPLDINFSFDTQWNVTLVGNFQNIPRNVIWKWVLIDNVGNSKSVTVKFGNQYSLTLPGGARQSFPIPNVNVVQFSGDATLTNLKVIFCEQQISPDTDNLTISFDRSNLLFPIQYVNTSRAMIAGDVQTTIVFNPGANMTYSLLPAASLANGSIIYLQNANKGIVPNIGFEVTILPDGADSINDVLVAATPLILSAGDSGILQSDGSKWNFRGRVSRQSADVAAPNNSILFQHNMMRNADMVERYIRCTIADLAYAVGACVKIPDNQSSMSPVNSTTHSFVPSMTNVQIFANPGTVLTNITLANWDQFVRVYTNW